MDALTDLQLSVMKALWRVGEGTVSDVGDALARSGRDLAPTTVATLLQRLAAHGWVAHRREGRQFVYRAKIKEKTAAKGALARVVRSFFDGRVSSVAAQLIESEDLTADDLREIRDLLEKRGGHGDAGAPSSHPRPQHRPAPSGDGRPPKREADR